MAKEKTIIADDRAVGIATWVLFQSIVDAMRIFACSVPQYGYSYVEMREIAFSIVNEVRKAFGYSRLEAFPGTPGGPGVQGETGQTEDEKKMAQFLDLDMHSRVEGWKKELWANIVTDLLMDEALVRLWKMDNAWFLDQTGRAQDLFNLDVIPSRSRGRRWLNE